MLGYANRSQPSRLAIQIENVVCECNLPCRRRLTITLDAKPVSETWIASSVIRDWPYPGTSSPVACILALICGIRIFEADSSIWHSWGTVP
jgi:hypothetical protein